MSEQLPTQRDQFPVDPHQAPLPAWPAGGLSDVGGDEGSGFDIRRYISALLRHKWLIAGITIVGAVAGVLATRFLTPMYTAQATVWIDSGNKGSGGRGPIRASQLLGESGWVELLRQFVVLDEVVRELKLYLTTNPADSAAFSTFGLKETFRTGEYRLEVAQTDGGFVLQTREGVVVQRGEVGDSIGAELGWAWVPPRRSLRPGSRSQFAIITPREAAVRLGNELDARVDRNGTFLKISLTGASPELIAATINRTVDRYVEVAARLKRDQLTELTRILEEQLDFAGNNLRQAEIALEQFRIRTITLPSEGGAPIAPGLEVTRGPVYDNFFGLKVEREQLRQDREAIQRFLAAADTGFSADALRIIPTVSASTELSQVLQEYTSKLAELRALRFRYTDQNPEVQRVLGELTEMEDVSLPSIARALIGDIRVREAELDRRIGSSAAELEEIPTRMIEEGRLTRAVAIAENLYTTLQARYEENRLSEAAAQADVSVLSPAVVPSRPIANTAPRVVALALLTSLGIGIGLALLLDRFDRRVRYPEQVSDDLGLTIVGAVPHVRANGGGLKKAEAVQVIESLRGIRLGLAHAHGAAGPMMVTITSPGSGDGKSFIASNLAIAFADAGHRTLLVDGDIRRGELHRVMGVTRKPGLTDVLDGSVGIDDAVQNSNHESLHVISAGTRMAAGPELLGSNSMQQLLINARSRYGVIIVDSPPLSAGVDPFILGTATGSMLLVMRTGVTDRQLAEAKMDVLERLPIRVLGAVLNDIRPNNQYRYYGYHYYVEGYEAEDEDPGRESGGKRRLTPAAD